MKRLIVAMSGASGAILGVRLLQALQGTDVETHLVMSRWFERTLEHETLFGIEQVKALASVVHKQNNLAASISSGSFQTLGMIVIPCSMKTLAAIAHGYSEDLLQRAADVVLKERRRLVLVPREAPLSEIHLENMLRLARMGAVIYPPVPAWYVRPESLADIENQMVSRCLEYFGIETGLGKRWDGKLERLES